MTFRISNYTNKKLKLKFKDEESREYEQVYPSKYLQTVSDVLNEGNIGIDMNGESFPIFFSDEKIIGVRNLPDKKNGVAIVVTRKAAEALSGLNRDDIFYPEVLSESASMITASELRSYRKPAEVKINVRERNSLEKLSEEK